MAATPEAKVKDRVKKILKTQGAYYTMPVASGFGNAGVPDILACLRGWFLGIECKANGGKPTALQLSNLKQIKEAGGVAVVVDETNMDVFAEILDKINRGEPL